MNFVKLTLTRGEFLTLNLDAVGYVLDNGIVVLKQLAGNTTTGELWVSKRTAKTLIKMTNPRRIDSEGNEVSGLVPGAPSK